MNLCLIRHADAAPPAEGGDDESRPLTDKGRRQCEALAEALQRFGLKTGPLVTSPLVRARETAEALRRHWSGPAPEVLECPHLAPGGKRRKLVQYLRGLDADSVTVIGHQPDLGRFAAWLIGNKKAQIDFAKAGAAFVESEVGPNKGTGVLAWLLTPAWYAAVTKPARAG
jgi:phosphohistidine phosphatase